jgi:hypothetical protein
MDKGSSYNSFELIPLNDLVAGVGLNFLLLSCGIGIFNLNKKAAPFIVQLFFMFFKNILAPNQ